LNLLNNPYFNALKNIDRILDADQRTRSVYMFLLLCLNAFFDVLGLATIIPLMEAAMVPEKIQTTWYLKYLYDLFGINDNISFLFALSILIFIVFLTKNIISLFIYYIQSKFAFNVSLRLSNKMYQYYYQKGYLFINSKDSGKKVYDNMTIPSYFAIYYLLETLGLSTELVVMILIFLGILYYSPWALFILFIIIIPVFLVVYLIIKNRTKILGEKKNILYPKALGNLIDSLNAYSDVKLANKEQYFFDKYKESIKEINELDSVQQGVFGKIHMRLNDIVFGLGLMVIFGFAYFFRENSDKIIALLSVFGIAAYRILPSVNRIMGGFITLKNFSFLIEELAPLKNKKIESYFKVETLKFEENILFNNICYSYINESENVVLKDISFEIKKGETIGIVGTSGSGKTTLLNVILRLLKETSGSILIDGNIVDDATNSSFQKTIGYVQQNVYIKNSSLKNNIAFGEDDSEIDLSKLNKAIQDSMLSSFVYSQLDGVDVELGENGTKLSGGQKQRIGIARALYKNSEIIVFDEATSALDTETERSIVEAINGLGKLNKTIIIVAHRITTLEKCDRILRLENGRIAEILSYKDLMKKAFDEQVLA
jgi:ATP-binding cassette, subfamily B, bacterial PglK